MLDGADRTGSAVTENGGKMIPDIEKVIKRRLNRKWI